MKGYRQKNKKKRSHTIACSLVDTLESAFIVSQLALIIHMWVCTISTSAQSFTHGCEWKRAPEQNGESKILTNWYETVDKYVCEMVCNLKGSLNKLKSRIDYKRHDYDLYRCWLCSVESEVVTNCSWRVTKMGRALLWIRCMSNWTLSLALALSSRFLRAAEYLTLAKLYVSGSL